jgi:hypothetical protein
MAMVDPLANMIRVMLNVSVNCLIPALAGGREKPFVASGLAPAE